MVLHDCPYCHRPFEAQLLSKEEIDSSEATKVDEFPIVPRRFRQSFAGLSQGGYQLGIFGLSEQEKNMIAMSPEAFITYKNTYRCKHCGKEWQKISHEEKLIPRQSLVDDQEKTDYDVHIEEEEAREEQYLREEQ